MKVPYIFLFCVFLLKVQLLEAGLLDKLRCKLTLTQRRAPREKGIPGGLPVLDIEGPFETHQGPQWVFRKKADYLLWESFFEPHPAAIQGNPNWLPELISGRASRFLGFKKVDSNTLRVPGAVRINAAIERVNAVVREKRMGQEYPLGFYFCTTERAPVREYLYRFAKKLQLPVSEGYPSMVHDVSYHYPAIFYPAQILKHAQAQTAFLLGFVKHLEEHVASFDPVEVKAFLDNLMYQKMKDIDEGTGNGFLLFRSTTRPMKHFYESVKQVASNGISPVSMLMNFTLNYQRLAAKTRDAKQLSPELLEFVKNYVLNNSLEYDFKLDPARMESLCSDVSSNLSRFERVAETIQDE